MTPFDDGVPFGYVCRLARRLRSRREDVRSAAEADFRRLGSIAAECWADHTRNESARRADFRRGIRIGTLDPRHAAAHDDGRMRRGAQNRRNLAAGAGWFMLTPVRGGSPRLGMPCLYGTIADSR